MDELKNDPEYEIRWPLDLLATVLDHLIARGRAEGLDGAWKDEVETVLRQAFSSSVPQREFQQQWEQSSRSVAYDEEPF